MCDNTDSPWVNTPREPNSYSSENHTCMHNLVLRGSQNATGKKYKQLPDQKNEPALIGLSSGLFETRVVAQKNELTQGP